ncbi:hypothetical protein U3516DRAFT_738753 [Neocallimastix sp. 'constans']
MIKFKNLTTTGICYEEQNKSDSDSDPSFDFCFNITTNIIIDSKAGINLSKNTKILTCIKEVINRGMTYPNEQSDRIYNKVMEMCNNKEK